MILQRTITIAGLTVREAIRSRLLLSLTSLLVTGLVGLPFLIGGDNTLAGKVQVIISYTLVFASAILSCTTLWLGCGGISAEIQDRRLYLVITKPIHRHELWLGKWLGIMMIDTGLLTLTGLIIVVMLNLTIHNANGSPEQKRHISDKYLLARRAQPAAMPDWSQLAEQTAARLAAASTIPENLTAPELRRQLKAELLNRHFSIPPGGFLQLTYPNPVGQTGKHDLIIEYKIDSSRPERKPIPLLWTIGIDPAHQARINVTNYPGVPCSVVFSGNHMLLSNNLAVSLQRLDTKSEATLMLAGKSMGPELLVPCGSFAMNLVRSLAIILSRLAFLAALGVAAGSLLSAPVAIFTSFFFIILLASSGYVESVNASGVFVVPHHHEGHEHAAAWSSHWLDQVILHLFSGLGVVTKPFTQLDPISLLTSGRVVGWDLTLLALGWLGGLYTGLTALIGIAAFRRKELG